MTELKSSMFRTEKSLEQMVNECIEVLKDEPHFDLTFLKGVKPFSNFYSQGQFEGVYRIYNRWNVELKFYSKTKKDEAGFSSDKTLNHEN